MGNVHCAMDMTFTAMMMTTMAVTAMVMAVMMAYTGCADSQFDAIFLLWLFSILISIHLCQRIDIMEI